MLKVVRLSVKMLGGRKVGEVGAPQCSGPTSDGLNMKVTPQVSPPWILSASSLPRLLHFLSVTLKTFVPASSPDSTLLGRY